MSVAAALIAALIAVSPAAAEAPSKCAAAPPVLWGDGEHDDTAALNAWFQGDNVIWAQTHEAVGSAIADRTFRLTAAVYVPSGTGRKLERFQLVWPERQEIVSGGTLRTGDDPKLPPVADGITMTGNDPDEGVPFPAPDPEPREHGIPKHCLTS
jgi:hypothetical protein